MNDSEVGSALVFLEPPPPLSVSTFPLPKSLALESHDELAYFRVAYRAVGSGLSIVPPVQGALGMIETDRETHF